MSKIRKATGQRIGQLICNALLDEDAHRDHNIKRQVNGYLDDDKFVGNTLFYIEDKDLIKLVQAYIKTLEVK